MAFKEEVRKFRIPVVLQDREHGFEILSQKRIRTRFAQGSHFCEIRTEILGKDREHAFLKISTKANSHKGCVVRKLLSLGFFSPIFPCFHHDFILQAFLPAC